MVHMQRFMGNPILSPDAAHAWEHLATFNGCPIQVGGSFKMLYRAIGDTANIDGKAVPLSTIGIASGQEPTAFGARKQFIVPQEVWDRFGCEDPRVSFVDGKYYIFYTALSAFPPNADSIKVAVAISTDLQKVSQRHLVTPFNAKAMALFPERVAGKLVGIVTVHTDLPPAKISLIYFDKDVQLWDSAFWNKWYTQLNRFTLPLLRVKTDHLEVGSPPIKTSYGWLLIYSYITNYQSGNRMFGIEAVLLDLQNPAKINGRTQIPLLVPEKSYELSGLVPNVIFPSGALVQNNNLGIYYGAADTTTCLATCNLDELLKELSPKMQLTFDREKVMANRFSGNPIIKPIHEHTWEDKFTLNPAAVYLDGKVHILYRAMGKYDTSVFGYAKASDGLHIDDRWGEPIYMPSEEFERKLKPGFSGCEDPRLTIMGDRMFMCYTAYDGINPTRVAFTSISIADFLQHNWKWDRPKLISPPGHDDKNACIFPEKIHDKFVFFHRQQHMIWLDYVNDLSFKNGRWLGGKVVLRSQPHTWYSEKVGIGPPPIKTDHGWLLIFHGLSKEDLKYRMGAMLLDLEHPEHVVSMLPYPILEPDAAYENQGLRYGTVFACGAVELGNNIYLYYGAADQFVCVASISRDTLLHELTHL